MHRLLLILACVALMGAPASAIVLAPVDECTWGSAFSPVCGGLDTRDEERATIVFDLTGIEPSQIASLSLEVVPIQSTQEGVFIGNIEAMGLSSVHPRNDPFINTLIFPQSGPCSPLSASCSVVSV